MLRALYYIGYWCFCLHYLQNISIYKYPVEPKIWSEYSINQLVFFMKSRSTNPETFKISTATTSRIQFGKFASFKDQNNASVSVLDISAATPFNFDSTISEFLSWDKYGTKS